MNCLISGDWILPYQPLLLSASSVQSLNLMRWKLYSGTLIPLPWNCRPLPLWIRITVSWLPMALPALFSALRLSHHQTTTVDRHDVLDGIKNVYIGDRGYCSYNNMAHVVEQGQYFLFRTKDIHSKGLVGNFNFPDAESFDIDVSVILVRSHSKKVLADIHTEGYIRFVD